MIRTYPSALALPLLLISLFVGAGLFGYFAFRSFESEGSVNAKVCLIVTCAGSRESPVTCQWMSEPAF